MMRQLLRQLLFVTLALLSPVASQAQTYTWTKSAGGSYDDSLAWSPVGVPNVSGENAQFNLPDTYVVSKASSGSEVSTFEVLDGDVTFVSADSNKVFTAIQTSLNGGDLSIDRTGTGRIFYDTYGVYIGGESTLAVLDTNIMTIYGYTEVGRSSTNAYGQLLVTDGGILTIDESAPFYIGRNTTDSDGTSRVELSGLGTIGTGSSFISVGSTGPGEFFVRDQASFTAVGTSFSLNSSGTNHFGSKVLVDSGATLSIEDPFGFNSGSSSFYGGTIEVLTGGRFNAGHMDRTGGTTTVDGAGSILRAVEFDLDLAVVNITNGATLEMETYSYEAFENNTQVLVDGADTTVRGSTVVFIESNSSLTLSGGAAWEPLDANQVFGMYASLTTDSNSTIDVSGSGTTMELNSEFNLASGLNTRSTLDVSEDATVTSDSFEAALSDSGQAIVTLDGGSLTVDTFTNFGGSQNGSGTFNEGGIATMTLLPDSLFHTKGKVVLGAEASINLYGGEWRVSKFEDIAGTAPTINWNNGLVAATSSTTLTPYAASVLTPSGSLDFGQELAVEGTLTLQTTLALNGGKLSLLGLNGGQLLQLNSGVFELLDDDLVIGVGGPLGEQFEMQDGLTLKNDQDVYVTGLLIGRGTIDAGFIVGSSGEARIGEGDRMTILNSASNSGRLELLGGRLDAESGFTNSSSGDLIGRGTLDIGGSGLTNRGDLALSNGVTDIFGDVLNVTTGRVMISGNADVTFWDDVTHSGTLFNVSTGSSATFFGEAGFSISGGGDVYFEGDITPGNSPGLETFGGDVHFGAVSTLVIELAGVALGTHYDSLDVAGEATLGGELEVELLDGFEPALGDVFTILSASSIAGTFDTLTLPTTGYELRYTASTVELIATSALAGDYTNDGIVDLADYTLWRNHLGATGAVLVNRAGNLQGTPVSAADYLVWKQNFGQTLSSFESAANSQVPEPASLCLLVAGACGALLMRRRVADR